MAQMVRIRDEWVRCSSIMSIRVYPRDGPLGESLFAAYVTNGANGHGKESYFQTKEEAEAEAQRIADAIG